VGKVGLDFAFVVVLLSIAATNIHHKNILSPITFELGGGVNALSRL
jgi:hypothetical protein